MAKVANVVEGPVAKGKKIEITPEAQERIDTKLWASVTWPELGLDLALRFGELKDLERQRDGLSREVGNVASHPKMAEIQKIEAKMKDREYRMRLAAQWTEAAKADIIERYGAEMKDAQGYITGYGEQITFDRTNGHLTRNW